MAKRGRIGKGNLFFTGSFEPELNKIVIEDAMGTRYQILI